MYLKTIILKITVRFTLENRKFSSLKSDQFNENPTRNNMG